MLERLCSFVSNNQAISRIRNFMYGWFYPIPFVILAFIGYCTTLDVLVIALFVIAACISLIICEDLRPLMPPLLVFIFIINLIHAPALPTYSTYYSSPIIICIVSILAALLLISFFLHYRLWGGFKDICTKRTHLTWFIIPLAAALLLNGLFADGYIPKDLLIGVITVFGWIILYLLFVNGLPKNKESLFYFCNTCQWIAILMIAQLLYVYIHCNVIEDSIIREDYIMFGWGVNNNYGGVVAWLLPPLFYLAAKCRHGWIHFLLAVVVYVCIVFSLCRSALLVGTIIFFICLVTICLKGKNQWMFRTVAFFLLAGVAIGIFAMREEIVHTFAILFDRGFSDTGRFDIWRNAVKIFKHYPIFGGGFHSAPFESWTGFMPGYCHNTVVQMLCACGGFGAIAYLAYRAKTIWIFVRHLTLERFFMGMLIIALLGVSMLDNHMFNVYPAFFYAIALAIGENDYNQTCLSLKAKQNLIQ